MKRKYNSTLKYGLAILCITLFLNPTRAQVTGGNLNGSATAEDDRLNTITTAVPFLLISPDSRHGALGDAGVATSPDVNAMHWNASKLAFLDEKTGISMGYTPWLRKLVPDISLSYFSFFYNLNKIITFGGGIKYFSLGDIQFTDASGNNLRQFRPNEFALNGSVAAKLSDKLSGGVTFKYIHSNLTGGTAAAGVETKPGQTVAADVSLYYQSDEFKVGDRKGELAAGLAISNMGGKVAYSNTKERDFLPINLRIGPRFTYHIDKYNKVSIHFDVNKLLVPTPPVYKYVKNAQGQLVLERDGDNLVIGAGKDPNRAVVEGMVSSFYDAPGNIIRDANGDPILTADGLYEVEKGSRFKEEMREINVGGGLEYWYDDLFAIRTGYFWEHELKGNRKYFTLGAGLRYKVLGLDFSYLIPAYFGSRGIQSPLQNTLRFTLIFNFKEAKSGASEGQGTGGA